MSFKLSLRFTGLCAFVPNSSRKAMRVLLVNTNHDHHAGHAAGNEPHEPALVFDCRDLAPANRREPEMTFSNGNPMGICFLEDQDLEIAAARQEALVFANGPAAKCPVGADLSSLSWVASLAQIDRPAAEVFRECFDPTDVHPTVAARVRLTEGTLRTIALSGMPQRSWVRWNFKPLESGKAANLDRAMAEVVELELDVPGSEVMLKTSRFRGSAPSLPPLILAPRHGRVVAWVKNMPLLDILGKRNPDEVVLNQQRLQDEHFEHYYTLSPNDPGAGKRPVPFPVGECIPAAPPPITMSPVCPPAMFQASPNA